MKHILISHFTTDFICDNVECGDTYNTYIIIYRIEICLHSRRLVNGYSICKEQLVLTRMQIVAVLYDRLKMQL